MWNRSVLENLEPRCLRSGSPAISIGDIAIAEGQNGATACVFTVSLSKPSSKRISVDFATSDGTARAGEDYVQTRGQLNFARGETSKTIAVQLNGDTTVEATETFSVKLSRACNAFLADSRAIGVIDNDDFLPLPPPPVNPPPYEPPPADDYPIWQDPTYTY